VYPDCIEFAEARLHLAFFWYTQQPAQPALPFLNLYGISTMIRTLSAFALLLLLAAPNARADFESDLSTQSDAPQILRETRNQAVAGVAQAQLDLGVFFYQGKTVSQDVGEAAKWFRLAADQGLAQAQYNMGMMYATGQGVPVDPAIAVKWYRLAAAQHLAIAQLNLGVAYVSGLGVEKNPSIASKWLRLAANQGDELAQFNLAVMYANGQGVTQNLPVAYRWAKLAAAQGHQIANKLIVGLTQRMTPQEIDGVRQIPDAAK
jgi:TPR repeat protein